MTFCSISEQCRILSYVKPDIFVRVHSHLREFPGFSEPFKLNPNFLDLVRSRRATCCFNSPVEHLRKTSDHVLVHPQPIRRDLGLCIEGLELLNVLVWPTPSTFTFHDWDMGDGSQPTSDVFY